MLLPRGLIESVNWALRPNNRGDLYKSLVTVLMP